MLNLDLSEGGLKSLRRAWGGYRIIAALVDVLLELRRMAPGLFELIEARRAAAQYGTCAVGCGHDPAGCFKALHDKCVEVINRDRRHAKQVRVEQDHLVEEQRRSDERVRLWAHLVSKHATCVSPLSTLESLTEDHDHEHEGPGTIRDHDPADRSFDLHTLGEVLAELEEGEDLGLK